ncbi:DUF2498 family protein [Vibrio tetraodonis]|uniref:DUF2498 family protein n=1 Tax=Vibrio tetraodonis TaxID=2231647 RepID=UPI000E0B0CE5|nr:DUF2498 family protein [Vibrio tetraodonis]
MNQRKVISKFELLLIANHLIQAHDNYIAGMRADEVEEKDGVLVFKGQCFLDTNGLPTPNSPSAFNILKYLTLHLSNDFTLRQS